jgi:hypothetical protein
MQVETIEAPQSATGTDAVTNLSDRTILQSFIIKNSAELRDLCHDAAKHKLFFTGPGAVIGSLFANLHRYGGPPIEPDFMKWARRFVSKEAARYEITGRLLAEHEDLIHKAISESLWTSAVDRAVEHQDIYWEIVFLIFQRAHSLDRPGKAKVSTRLWALVEKHVYLYHNKRTHQRRKLVQLRKNELQCEHFSDEELAAMRAEEAGDAAWDPGYAEAGLSMI